MNIKKIKLVFSLFVILLSQSSFSQDITSEALNSLGIDEAAKEKLLLEYTSSTTDPGGSKSYKNKSSLINKNEKDNEKKLKRFGDSFFKNTPLTYMPVNDPAANSGYILDIDDLLFIQIIGDKSFEYEYRVDRSGSINLNDIGNIRVAGLSIENANILVNETLKKSFVQTSAIISLKEVRDISVLITGHVENPGFYILNGYSNIMHAIIMAGGISESGSYRKITIKRNGQDDDIIDLYDLFVFADTSSNYSLRSGDSIYVEASTRFVPILGAVARQGIYEFIDGENLGDLINYSGGLTNLSNNEVILSRKNNDNTRIRANSENSTLIKIDDRVFVPFKGFMADQMYIAENEQFINIPVQISGAVQRPGNYFIEKEVKLSSLIKKAGGYLDNANVYGGVLINNEAKLKEAEYNKRLYDEAIKSLASISQSSKGINIPNLLPILSEFKDTEPSGRVVAEFELSKIQKNPSLDSDLSPGDKIYIPFKTNFVYIFGEVLKPGTVTFKEGYSPHDYIEASGGLSSSADKTMIIQVNPNGETIKLRSRNNIFLSSNQEITPGSIIYVSRDMRNIEGIDFAKAISPIVSSLAISLASLNSINRN